VSANSEERPKVGVRIEKDSAPGIFPIKRPYVTRHTSSEEIDEIEVRSGQSSMYWAFVSAAGYLGFSVIPLLSFSAVTIWAIWLDATAMDKRQIPGMSVLLNWSVLQFPLIRVDLYRVGIPFLMLIGLYGTWFVCFSAITVGSEDGYQAPWVPPTESHRWISSFGMNGLSALLFFLIQTPFLFVVPALLEPRAATINVLAHERLHSLQRTQDSLSTVRDKLLASVMRHVPRFARQCLAAEVLAFENRRPVLIAVRVRSFGSGDQELA